ncbi:MAG: YibE/F family protein [Cellulomonadaceae bacterium]
MSHQHPTRRARHVDAVPAQPGGLPHAHGHGHGHGKVPRSSTRVRLVLGALLIPILAATVVGMIALWPHDAPSRGELSVTAGTAGMVFGTVTAPPADDGTTPFELESGEQVTVIVPPEYVESGVAVGDQLKVLHVPEAAASGSEYVFMDFKRDLPMGILAVAYAIVVVAVARWRGLAAMAGLVVAFGVIVTFTLPGLLAGQPPLPVALVTSCAVMFVVLYLAHGLNARTSTALLGTVVGLLITVLLAAWATGAAHITGLEDEYARQLPAFAPDVDIRGIALCGIVLAGLGVLNDVTITQASAVWELRAVSPNMSRLDLFRRGMRIGRDHIASTVYTIAFAYLGAALPLLLMVSLIDQSLGQTLSSGEIATEVVRTLVGSIGLVLAIPITTAIAAVTVGGGPALAAEDRSGPAAQGPQGAGDGRDAPHEQHEDGAQGHVEHVVRQP